MATFIERLHALPAELYNEIRHLTFTVTFDTIHIDAAYKPPALLQVNRSIRMWSVSGIQNVHMVTFSDGSLGTEVAKSYYGNNSIFYVDRDIIGSWLKSVEPAHASMLNEVRISKKLISIVERPKQYHLCWKLRGEYHKIFELSKGVGWNILPALRFEINYSNSKGTKWVLLSHLARDSLAPLMSARRWVEIHGTE